MKPSSLSHSFLLCCCVFVVSSCQNSQFALTEKQEDIKISQATSSNQTQQQTTARPQSALQASLLGHIGVARKNPQLVEESLNFLTQNLQGEKPSEDFYLYTFRMAYLGDVDKTKTKSILKMWEEAYPTSSQLLQAQGLSVIKENNLESLRDFYQKNAQTDFGYKVLNRWLETYPEKRFAFAREFFDEILLKPIKQDTSLRYDARLAESILILLSASEKQKDQAQETEIERIISHQVWQTLLEQEKANIIIHRNYGLFLISKLESYLKTQKQLQIDLSWYLERYEYVNSHPFAIFLAEALLLLPNDANKKRAQTIINSRLEQDDASAFIHSQLIKTGLYLGLKDTQLQEFLRRQAPEASAYRQAIDLVKVQVLDFLKRPQEAQSALDKILLAELDTGQHLVYLGFVKKFYGSTQALNIYLSYLENEKIALEQRVGGFDQATQFAKWHNLNAALFLHLPEEFFKASKNPSLEEQAIQKSTLYYALNQASSIVRELSPLEQQNSQNSNFLNTFGYLLADLNVFLDKADSLLHAAFAIRPEEPAILDSLAWLYYRQGKAEKAKEFVTKAYLSFSVNEIVAHLIVILHHSGQNNQAQLLWDYYQHQLGLELNITSFEQLLSL